MANFLAAIDRYLPNSRQIKRIGFKTRPIEAFIQSQDLRVTIKAYYDDKMKKNVFEVFTNEHGGTNHIYNTGNVGPPKLIASGIMDAPPQPTTAQATLP